MNRFKTILPLILVAALSAAALPRQADGLAAANEPPEYRRGEVIVELKPGASIETVNARYGTKTVRQIYGTNFYRLQTPNGKKESKWRKRLAKDAEVLSAALNPVITYPSLFARITFSFPDGFARPGYTLADYQAQQGLFDWLKLEAVGERSRGRDTVVAVIDTGIDYTHAQLAASLWHDGRAQADVAGDGIDNDGDGLLDDVHGWDFVGDDNDPLEKAGDPQTTVAGHGTFISGIITMLAPECRILPVRAFPPDGIGDGFTVAAAVKYAADHGADVINLSLGAPVDLPLLRDAINDAVARGIVVVAAVGNDNSDAPQFPSNMTEVAAVAAIDLQDHKARFSNFGAHVDVCAPGVALVSAYPGGYAQWSGTSFAAPFVAAEAALLLSADHQLGDVKQLIESTATSLDGLNPGLAGGLGRGRIDPLGALQKLNTDARPPVDAHLQAELVRGAIGGEAYGRVTINVVGAAQELTVEAYRLNARGTYKLVVDGNELDQSPSDASNLGSLRFAYSNAKAALPPPINPVTRVRHVELRDGLNRVVLQCDIGTDAPVTPPRTLAKEAHLAAVAASSAAGRAVARIEALPSGVRRETLLVSAEGLKAGATYRLMVDGLNLGLLFAPSGFTSIIFTSDGSRGQALPAALRPVVNVRRVELLDERGQVVLRGDFAVTPIGVQSR